MTSPRGPKILAKSCGYIAPLVEAQAFIEAQLTYKCIGSSKPVLSALFWPGEAFPRGAVAADSQVRQHAPIDGHRRPDLGMAGRFGAARSVLARIGPRSKGRLGRGPDSSGSRSGFGSFEPCYRSALGFKGSETTFVSRIITQSPLVQWAFDHVRSRDRRRHTRGRSEPTKSLA